MVLLHLEGLLGGDPEHLGYLLRGGLLLLLRHLGQEIRELPPSSGLTGLRLAPRLRGCTAPDRAGGVDGPPANGHGQIGRLLFSLARQGQPQRHSREVAPGGSDTDFTF